MDGAEVDTDMVTLEEMYRGTVIRQRVALVLLPS